VMHGDECDSAAGLGLHDVIVRHPLRDVEAVRSTHLAGDYLLIACYRQKRCWLWRCWC
jgi:hypothetical protein